jgi:hypothetical protein
MKYFLLDTQSDKGRHFLKTNASDKETAINNFCNLYNAPKQAVKNVYEFDLMYWNFQPKTIINKLGTKV